MKNKGFTLIELMIALAIIAILAMIALPSYQLYVMKSNRALAQGCMLEFAQDMERYYTTNMTYAGATIANTSCASEVSGRYAFSGGTPTATTFTITATPQLPQQNQDSCGTMTLNQAGVKTTTGTVGCW